MDVWGDMPRDIQEALFETAMKAHDIEREELARLLHGGHPRTLQRRSQAEPREPASSTPVYLTARSCAA
jgi:hypothetical protein